MNTIIMTIVINCPSLRYGPRATPSSEATYELFSGAVPAGDATAKYVTDVDSAAQANELGKAIGILCDAIHAATLLVLTEVRLGQLLTPILQRYASKRDGADNLTAIVSLTNAFTNAHNKITALQPERDIRKRIENAIIDALISDMKIDTAWSGNTSAFTARLADITASAIKNANDAEII